MDWNSSTFITGPEVAARLKEAATTLRRMPMHRNGVPLEPRACWPDITRDFWEAWNAYLSDETSQMTAEELQDMKAQLAEVQNYVDLKPTPQQVSRMEEALRWVYMIEDGRKRRIVWLLAMGASYRRVSRVFGGHHRTAKKLWEDTCETLSEKITLGA